MLTKFVRTAADLVTSLEATQQGFLNQTIRKSSEARPYVEEALKMQAALLTVSDPTVLADDPALQLPLLTACGFSDKSLAYFGVPERAANLKSALTTICKAAGEHWRDEILFRFMLTKGDSLGGSMRNIVGAEASARFVAALLAAVGANHKGDPIIKTSDTGKIQGVAWPNRLMLFDRSPKFVGGSGEKKNIDVILLRTTNTTPTDGIWTGEKDSLNDPARFVACGELKGGIDPAGADEHWKTAKSGVDRIRARFTDPPKLFFVGAAIATAMASEIVTLLQEDKLDFAANLTVPEQLDDLTNWLARL